VKAFGRYKVTARHAASSVAVAASLYFSLSQIQNDRLRQRHDLELSSALLVDALRETVEPLAAKEDIVSLQYLCERFSARGRLVGIAVYGKDGRALAATRSLAPRLKETPPKAVADCLDSRSDVADYEAVGSRKMRVNAVALGASGTPAGALAAFHDTAYIEARAARTRWSNARRVVIQAALFLAAVWVFGLFFD
jgi:hypothetical protein